MSPNCRPDDQLNPDVLTGQEGTAGRPLNAMKTLPERYQAVIGLYYVGGKTMREIGDKLGINESRVRRFIARRWTK